MDRKTCYGEKRYKELDESILQKVRPYLYNDGAGAMVPIAQMACIRNRDRSVRKQVCYSVP